MCFVDHSVHNSLSVLLDRPAAPTLRGITIQFPDPWAKAKTKRRRILQPSLAEMFVNRLAPDGFVYFSTDCAGVAKDMELVMDNHCASGVMRRATVLAPARASVSSADAEDGSGGADRSVAAIATGCASAAEALSQWLPFNPFGVPSERERVCGELGRPVYRALYYKVSDNSVLPVST